jgi:hypothetical protein
VAEPTLPPPLTEGRSDERETFGLVNALRKLVTVAANVSTILDVLGATRGSVLYRGANGWTVLSPGAAGERLTSNGAGADPSWQP